MNNHSDQIIEHLPYFCCECGCDLQAAPIEFIGKRQVIDIPEVKGSVN